MSKRPWEHLPLPPPSEFDPSIEDPDFFYREFIQPLSADFIRLMSAGLHVDQDAIEELRGTVTEVVADVQKRLNENPLIIDFQNTRYKQKYQEYLGKMETKKKPIEHFIKTYNPDNIVHRTYLVNEILEVSDLPQYKLDKWTINDIKKLLQIEDIPALQRVVNKNLSVDVKITTAAMYSMAEDKARIYNKSHYSDKIANKTRADILPDFNAGSPQQKQKLFRRLGIEPLKFSKDTGEPSWDRKTVEQLQKMTPDTEIELHGFLQAFIDYSYSNIIKTNFMEAFDRFVIDDVLYGNFKLFGAKTARPTSNNPNMLNMPSTGSIYSKPLKKCLVAPLGYLVWTIDYSALEDRVIANLSGDENKLSVFTEGVDGHSLGATYYFPNRVTALIGEYTDNKLAARKLKQLVDDGDKDAKKIRQDGKPVTFGLSYGSFPPKVAETIKCSLEEATIIFNAYHDEMYPTITEMRNTALEVAKQQGYIHMGLGCRMYSDNIELNARTLFNGLSQFWSILTLISINELNYYIDKDQMNDVVVPNSSIYDAIYGIIKEDAESIKWLNDTICPIMEKDFITDQIVHNEANLEIGTSWADMVELEHNLTIDQIQSILDEDIHQI